MKICLITIVYNEEKFLPFFLNHYTKFCDKLIFYNNLSTDNSCQIIKSYSDTKIINYNTDGKIRDDVYLKIKNEVFKKYRNYDWVIICDIDEILYHPDLIELLGRYSETEITMPVIEGYNMVSKEFPSDTEFCIMIYDKQIYDQVQHGVRATNFDKQIIFNPNKIININYSTGCHKNNAEGEIDKGLYSDPIKLLHYKYLGKLYVSGRHRLYANRLSKFNLKYNLGWEYKAGEKHIDECFQLLEDNKKKII